MCLSVFYKKPVDMHSKPEYFIWRDDYDNAGCVASLLGALGVLPGKVTGLDIAIPLPCSISHSVNC